MKISLDTRLAQSPRPNIIPDQWHVSEVALLTASAIAARASSELTTRFVDRHVEVLRFRFIEECVGDRGERKTLFKFAGVITVGGKRYECKFEPTLEMPHNDHGGPNYQIVEELSASITSFVCEELKKVVDAQQKEFDMVKRRLSARYSGLAV